MNTKQKNISKFLAFILRHKPENFGIKIEKEGWVLIEEVISAGLTHNHNLTHSEINEVVLNCNKQRFEISPCNLKIRAVQGHSVKEVNISFKKETPPEFLFHGTSKRFLKSIMETGLQSMSRQFVHLSTNKKTAHEVGMRHGNVVMLVINSKQMEEEGYKFLISANNVWLTEKVPLKYISIEE